MWSLLMMLMPFLVLGGVGLVAVAFYRRLSGPGSGEVAGSFHEKLLYEIDRLRVQMQIANERLERLEAGYLALPRGDEPRGTRIGPKEPESGD